MPHASSPFLNKRDDMFHGDHVAALRLFLESHVYSWPLAILFSCLGQLTCGAWQYYDTYQLASILLPQMGIHV
jgi:hypothetical protein